MSKVIKDNMGQWKHPGKVTQISSGDITMHGVDYPVLGIDNMGNSMMMMPDLNYQFPGNTVTEYPMMQMGGSMNPQQWDVYNQQRGWKVDPRQNYGSTANIYKQYIDPAYSFNQDTTIVSGWKATGPGLDAFGTIPATAVSTYQKPVKRPQIQSSPTPTWVPAGQTSTGEGLFVRGDNPQGGTFTYTSGAYTPYKQAGGEIGPDKARAILEDGSVYNRPLTQKQIDYFSRVAGVTLDDDGEIVDNNEPDEDTEDFRYGGTYMRNLRKPKRKSGSNIKSSINYLLARNEMLFGEAGNRIYDPNKREGGDCYECGGGYYMDAGGGLSRSDDYGSSKKPYPSVSSSDFAGAHRSYPIPTRADAIDALRLAGLHGREDVKAKVYAKYPDLKKEQGGECDFTQGQSDDNFLGKKKMDFLQYLTRNNMEAIANQEADRIDTIMKKRGGEKEFIKGFYELPVYLMQYGGSQGYNYFPMNYKDQTTVTNPDPNVTNEIQTNGQFTWDFAGRQQPQITQPQSDYPIVQMDPNQMQGMPVTSGQNMQNNPEVKTKRTRMFDDEASANWILSGMNAISSIGESVQNRKAKERLKSMQGADSQFYSNPSGDRGDYDINSGMFRPNDMTAIQFAGQNFGTRGSNIRYQEGGEYMLSDEEITDILRNGGEIEYID